MADIKDQLIKDSYNYVLQSDLGTGVVYRIGGAIPVNPIFQSGLTVNDSFIYSNGTEGVGYALLTDGTGYAYWAPVSAATPSSGVTSVTGIDGIAVSPTTGNVVVSFTGTSDLANYFLPLSGGTVSGFTSFNSGVDINSLTASSIYLGYLFSNGQTDLNTLQVTSTSTFNNDVTIDTNLNVTQTIYAGTISATTYLNYPDSYVTGFSLSSNTITLSQNRTDQYSAFTISLSAYTGNSLSGDYLPLSGGTVSGNTYFTSGLSANTLFISGLTQTSGITSTGGITFPQKTVSSTYTVTDSDYMVDVTGGTFNVQLPTAVGVQGRLLAIKNNGGGAVTILPYGSEKIDDKTLLILSETNAVQLVSNGAQWVILGQDRSTVNNSTGVFEFSGLSKVSSTQFSVARVRGWIVDDTSNPLSPQIYYVDYSGGTHTDIYVNTSFETFVYLTSGATIGQQATPLTEQQRRQNIFLGKIGHPEKTSINLVFSQPDFVLSPLAQLRDVFAPINLINGGVYPSVNTGLTFNTSAGFIYGLGINFSVNTLQPNAVTIPGQSPCTFQYRTQTGGSVTNITQIDPTKWDDGGVVTPVSGVKSTNQRIYLLQNGQFRIQYGQEEYNQLSAAIAGIQTETFTVFPNFTNNAILIGILSITSTCNDLSDTSRAQIFLVSKFGETVGAAGGIGTTTLQQAYLNSSEPEITINSTLDGISIKNGTTSADTVAQLIQGISSGGTITSFIRADGAISGTTFLGNGGNLSHVFHSVNINGTPQFSANTNTFINFSGINLNIISGANNTLIFSAGTGGSSGSSGFDVYVTGGTYNGSEILFTNNSGGTFTVTGLTATGFSANYYGSFSDSTNQPVSGANIATVWKYNTTEISNGISVVDNTKITVQNTGVYEIGYSAQIEKTQGTEADVTIWAKINGQDVERSSSTLGLVANSVYQLPFVSYIFDLNAGDYVEFYFSSDSQYAQLTALSGLTTPTRPDSPSVIIVAKQVGLSTSIGGSGDTFVTGFSLNNNAITLSQNRTDQYSAFTISLSAYTGSSLSGDYLPLSGGTVTGGTQFTEGLTANTISATTYQNLPVSGLTGGNNISVTGSNGNFTISFTGTTGSNFTGGTVSGATIFTDGLTANTISATTYYNLPQVVINNTLTVALTGSSTTNVDFNTIKDAVNSITGATSANTYTVQVAGGVYNEDPFTIPSWVSVVGESSISTVINANDSSQTLIRLSDQSAIFDCQIQGCTDTGVSAVLYSSSTTPQSSAISYVENVRFGANYTHAKVVAYGGANIIMQCSNVKYGGYPFTIGFYATNSSSGSIGRMQLRNVTSTNGGIVTTTGLIFAKADAASCGFIVNGCLLTKAVGAAAGTGFYVENGGFLRLTAVNFQRWAVGIDAPQIGSAPSIDAIALNFENNTIDVNIAHSGATGKIQGTDNFLKTIINPDCPLYEVNQDPKEITVAKKGGDFTSIKSAVDYLVLSGNTSSTNRYIISVGPGEFTEGQIDLTNTPYVSIVGSNIQTTLIKPSGNTQHIISIGVNNEVSFLTLSGAPSGYAGIYCYDIGDFAQSHKVSFYDCDTNVWIESNTQDTKFFGEYLDYNGDYTYGTKVIGNNGYLALANMENYYNFPTGAGITYCNYATGTGATLSIFVGDNQSNGVSGSTAYYIQNKAELNASTITSDGFTYGIRNPNIGDPVTFDVDNASFVNGEWDLYIERAYTFGTFAGSSSHEKLFTNSSDVYWSILDIDDGEFDITRKASVTFADGTHTDFTTLIFEGGSMGVISGGTLTDGGGTTVNVAAGFGYLEKSIDNGVVKRIDWSASTLSLSGNSDLYIYFNENEILSSSGTRPDSSYNITLGRIVTDSSSILIIDQSPFNASHTSNRFGNLFREALGPIYAFGSITTEGVTPFTLDVTQGEYYYSTNEFLPIGGTGITFTQYYRTGTGSTWVTSSTTLVNNTQYDNNGTLTGLTASAYTKHTLYVVGDGVDEQFMLVLGQDEYTTLVEAENALLPTPPSYFTDSVAQIASIYIRQGSSNIIQIEDIRPTIGFRAGGVNASSVHGNLLGLTADDHLQYLLVDGARAMSGNLNMGGNSITSALTINGVTIQTHATRHQFGGADPVGTVTPTANAIPYADTNGKLDGWITPITISGGTGITTGGTYPNFTLTNSDRGSSQNIFKNIKIDGNIQFSANSNNSDLNFSGVGLTITSGESNTLIFSASPGGVTSILANASDGISASSTTGAVTLINTRPQGITGITGTNGVSASTNNYETTIINTDKGSDQFIFKNIKIGTITQFSANSNNSDLNFSGVGITITSAATNTLVFTNSLLQGITGITGTTGVSADTTGFFTTIINTDRGSSQNIFKNIQIGGITQFGANSNNSDLNFSGIGISITSAATNTLVFTNQITQGITGITSGDGITATTSDNNVTITNLGVTGITAGYGISASTSTGNVTLIQQFDYGKAYTTGNNLNYI
jgi:hypothetical protein